MFILLDLWLSSSIKDFADTNTQAVVKKVSSLNFCLFLSPYDFLSSFLDRA